MFAYTAKLRSLSPGTFAFLGTMDHRPTSVVKAYAHLDNFAFSSRTPLPPVPFTYVSRPTSYVFEDPLAHKPVHATYFPPTNPDYDSGSSNSTAGELPPAIVNVHGGPTHFVPHGLSWEKQFFTSRGFAWRVSSPPLLPLLRLSPPHTCSPDACVSPTGSTSTMAAR